MWSKADFYSAVAKETLEGLTASWQEWAKFLTTASRLYKYPFMDQMMIYAQRPDATACAEYDLWNDKMNRYVRRGSKGIALLDERGDKLRLRYVFDVADTGTRENSRTLGCGQWRISISFPLWLCWNETTALVELTWANRLRRPPELWQTSIGQITRRTSSTSLTIPS